ncbi:hypothetical protein [uncultured Rhodoferax sp.]|uniref:hypothetical protein n=1 Tax=uncultured Rhodoferax sp. TaxID=223188 RepID=UPI0025D82FF6|nr:hypothetical protein [uncultured Rhodoferax sp.]
MKPLFAVVFTQDAPTELFCIPTTMVTLQNGQRVQALSCTEFAETKLGFLRLLPKSVDEKQPSMALHVHPQHVLFAMQADQPSSFGFLSKAA